MIDATLPCLTCRSGRCATHGLKRIVVHSSPVVVADEAMTPVGCCDRFEGDLKRRRANQAWRYCPWCGAKRA